MLMLFFLYRFRFLLGPSLPRPPAYSRQRSPPGWVPPSCKAPLWSVFSYLATNRDHRSRAFSHTAVSSRRAAFRRHQPRNYSAQRSLSARLGDSCYFARCEIVKSLLRRGARCRSALESWSWLGNKLRLPCAGGGPTKAKITPAKHPTGAPGGRCLPALGIGHSGEKTVFVRAPGKFFRFNSSLKRSISLFRRGARGLEGTALRGQRSLRRTGGASRHPAGACRERKQSLSARWRILFRSPAGISSRLCSRTTSEIPS